MGDVKPEELSARVHNLKNNVSAVGDKFLVNQMESIEYLLKIGSYLMASTRLLAIEDKLNNR